MKRPITRDFSDPSTLLGVSDKDLGTNSQTVIYGEIPSATHATSSKPLYISHNITNNGVLMSSRASPRSCDNFFVCPPPKFLNIETGYTVHMVTHYVIKMTIIGSPMAGHLRDTNIVVSLDKQR